MQLQKAKLLIIAEPKVVNRYLRKSKEKPDYVWEKPISVQSEKLKPIASVTNPTPIKG